MNISNTYLGYTDNIKPMQKAKIENTLNNLIRDSGKVMSEKEWVYKKLQSGYTPIVENDVSHYSRKLGDYTKPKTEYALSNGDYSSTINKTLYDYACYIVSNGFLNTEKAISYITAEEQANREKAEAEADKIAAEKAEREAQDSFTNSQKERITAAANYCMENYDLFKYAQYSNIPENERLEFMYNNCERLIIEDHLYNEYVIESMKRYKKEVMVTFYRFINGQGYIESQGEKFEYEDITTYIYNSGQGSLWAIEEQTGCKIAQGKNKTEVKQNLKDGIEKTGKEKLNSLITGLINKNGLSPTLQNVI
jgi:hypothetical protein